jgi:hypothetical protein
MIMFSDCEGQQNRNQPSEASGNHLRKSKIGNLQAPEIFIANAGVGPVQNSRWTQSGIALKGSVSIILVVALFLYRFAVVFHCVA